MIQIDTSRLEHYSCFLRELSIIEDYIELSTLEYLAPHLPSDFCFLPRTRVLKLHLSGDMEGFDMLIGPELVDVHIEIDSDWTSMRCGITFLARMCCVCTNLEVLRLDIRFEGEAEAELSSHVGTFVQMVQSTYPRLRILHLLAIHDYDYRCDPEFTSRPIIDLLRTTCARAQEFSSVHIPVPENGVIKLARNPNLRDVWICLDETPLERRIFEGIHRPFSALHAMRFSVKHMDESSLSFLGSVSSAVLTRLIIDVEDDSENLDPTMLCAHIQCHPTYSLYETNVFGVVVGVLCSWDRNPGVVDKPSHEVVEYMSISRGVPGKNNTVAQLHAIAGYVRGVSVTILDSIYERVAPQQAEEA
ncbi:hypothetical protein POSPLADRAFT_1157218 [Postia placenta MAD-698-R-SB12]|uniref:Uncharacterized protein n=1 Tax=Postia placenta MAD-698-R-SB12 TaxID=670580 RepID=A0A1X6MMG1_9APHY|nr:hypothetical protein POSPLADRAFT_1157218 [Postia placenta MAD-698-R-SB12]OSX57362.1 hypothetical protein POSPLADRAFT_1157218 [Postia placenta MAD-698-R-SB12]